MLMEEEELINKIMSVATEKPTGHEEIMKWVNELYGKTMSYYGDFENIIYSFVRVSLLTGMKVMAIKNQVNSMAIEWKKGQYNIPLQRVLGCEKSFMASDKYSKLVEKAIVKELK